jgi:hypothetical protein
MAPVLVPQPVYIPPPAPPGTAPPTVSRIFPLPSIFAGNDPPIQYIVPGFIMCGGITLLTAAPKNGKTTFTTALCWHVVRGLPFLGLQITAPRPVIYFDFENPKAIVKKRFERLHLSDGDGFNYFYKHKGQPFPWSAEIVAEIAEMHPRPLIIVDSFLRTYNGTNENDNVQIRQYYAQYDLLTELGCAVFVQDHTDRNNLQTSRGGGDKECVVDFGFKLFNAGRGTGLTELHLEPFVIREGEFEPLYFRYDKESGAFICRDKAEQIESILRSMLVEEMNTTALEQHPSLKAFDRKDVRKIRDRLVDKEILERKPGRNNREQLYSVRGRPDADALMREWEERTKAQITNSLDSIDSADQQTEHE